MSELATTQNTVSLFNTQNMQTLMSFAETMAQGQVSTPNHRRGKAADCLAVAMQAAQWGMNPFAVAQKTHLVNGTLGYEAQLINAVISSSTAITGRFHYEQIGDWSKWELSKRSSEDGLGVRVGAVLNGESEITWGEVVWLAPITIRNSPLWKTNPYQQICYLAMKYWARLYTPDVILGVYDKEELTKVEREINPMSEKKPTSPPKRTTMDNFFDEPEQIEAPTDTSQIELSKFEQLKDWCFEVNTQADYDELVNAIRDAVNNKELSKPETDELRKCAMSIRDGLNLEQASAGNQ